MRENRLLRIWKGAPAMKIRNGILAVALAAAALLPGCHSVEHNRLPPAPVNLVFNTVADWDRYGTPGALSFREFIKTAAMRVPADYPYTATNQTGFGGILVCGDVYGAPVAYDLACPVEMKADVRIHVDTETNKGVCDRCGSTYDIFSNYGYPLSGPAAEHGYGLTKYYIGAGPNYEYMVVSR